MKHYRYLNIGVLLALYSYPTFAQTFKEEFVSPDRSCRILYEGASDHGNGVFYDISDGKKKIILKEYVRIGPQINSMSSSIAEIFFSETKRFCSIDSSTTKRSIVLTHRVLAC